MEDLLDQLDGIFHRDEHSVVHLNPEKALTVEQVQTIAGLIAADSAKCDHCDSRTHEYRDALYIAVMTNVSNGAAADPSGLTAAALKVEAVPFPRYFD